MYSNDTLKRYHDRLESTIEFYARFPVESLEICISGGNMKVGNVPNVSLPPVKTCGNCSACIHKCYDIKACLQYENVIKARSRNYSILVRNYDLYWEQLRERLSRMRSKYFRFHVGGDIISERYFDDIVKTRKMFPHIRFWTYTKSHSIVNEYTEKHGGRRKVCGNNLTVMFSVWAGKPIENPHNYPVFYVYEHGQPAPKGMWKCPSDCKYCIEHKRGCPYGESTCIEEH